MAMLVGIKLMKTGEEEPLEEQLWGPIELPLPCSDVVQERRLGLVTTGGGDVKGRGREEGGRERGRGKGGRGRGGERKVCV